MEGGATKSQKYLYSYVYLLFFGGCETILNPYKIRLAGLDSITLFLASNGLFSVFIFSVSSLVV